MATRQGTKLQAPQHGLTRPPVVFDAPIRLWHWAFAGSLTVSLVTGLADDVGLMDVHLGAGYCVLGLLLFRLGWFVWGGRHSRAAAYVVTPQGLLGQVRGRSEPTSAHTPFGALLLFGLWSLVVVQATTGLFASDDIFTEGPLASRLDDDGVELATSIHTRVFWPILALVAGHLTAIAWYSLVRRDRLPLAMFDGRKAGPPAEPRAYALRALATLAASSALVYALVEWG